MKIRTFTRRAALVAAWLAGTALAGSFTSDFSNPNQTGFTLTSNYATRPDSSTFEPVITDGHLILTYNENSEQGTIIINDLDGGAAIESFTMKFKLQIGPGSGNPADGLSVAFGPDVMTDSNFGEEGIGTGLVVAFDIYNNGNNEAPAIDVKYGGVTLATTPFAKADMVTSQFEDVEISLTRAGMLNVSYKGQKLYENLRLADFVPMSGLFAIGARTGGENANHWIDDLQITTVVAGAATSPSITAQPQSQTVNEGAPVSFSVGFDGSAPLTFQWLANNAPIAGATLPSYSIARAPFSLNGAKIKCTVTNSAGSATSQEATLTVNADTTAPVLQYATGTRSYTGVRVWFSEPLDPATAQDPFHYQLSGGVTVSSASLVGGAGSAGDNMVDLVTSAQTAGQTYTLTVNGVRDASSAANEVAANSTVQFGSWTLTQGVLLFEHWDGLSGAGITDLENALTDPRVVADTPTTLGWLSGEFNTRTFFPDDSHENYLAKITGWLTPTESGDYYFFLRADDAARLYLSTTEAIPNPALEYPICEEPDCCDGFYEPDTFDPATTPTPISLQAGKRYGILALLKEAGGGDYLMVAWRKSTDTTPAASLPYLPGQFLSAYWDPNVELSFTQQPADQVGVLPSTGIEIFSRDFNANDGGFTVINSADEPPFDFFPWEYDSSSGKWVAVGSPDGCGGPYNSRLTSPAYKLTQDGAVSLSFVHRYAFEPDLWDAGQVWVSVNGGDFTLVPAENFTANGYATGNIVGTGVANGKRAFNGDSPGYAAGQFITSEVSLGRFSKDDTVAVQFVAAWDECATGKHPNWEIDSMKMTLLPMTIQDFAKGDGGYTVQNSGTPPANWGPWAYDTAAGQWVAMGSTVDCGGPFNSKLTSPAYTVSQSDEVTLNFSHRYRLEGDYYDGGQVWISVNGGEFTPVSPDNFTANGYAPGNIVGTGILQGKRAFNGDSPGFDAGTLITSSVILGTFNQGDTIAVQFVGAWDECWSPGQPGWIIKNVQLLFGKAAKAVTFDAQAIASRQGTPQTITYQWQRDDGAGFKNILGANTASLRLFPIAADFNAAFRVTAGVPGKIISSNSAKIVTALTEPEISIARNGANVVITFTGMLQSAPAVTGPFTDVAGAQSPYTVPDPTGTAFFRAAQ